MHTLLTFAVGVVAAADGAAHESGDALSLLQMSSAKVSMHSEKDDKECTAATKAHKSAKKQAKTDKRAAKEARAAWKVANQAMVASNEAEAAALAKLEAACPLPEVDNSPDVGCSTTLLTSLTPSVAQRGAPLLLERGLPGAGWYGFKEVLPGGGAPKADFPNGDGQGKMIPQSTKEERNIGIAVMRPCSVAWTVGMFKYPTNQVDHATGKIRTPGYFQQSYNLEPNEQIFLKKDGVKNVQECRAWAETVMKWPDAAVVQFSYNPMGGGAHCHVFSMTKIPFKNDGFSLTLVNSANNDFACYLGNPEEWKHRLAAEKAAGQTIDKCSKTSLWSSGAWEMNGNRTSRSVVGLIPVGVLSWPNPLGNTEGGRKSCLKWVKKDPKCANAVAIELKGDNCYCTTTTNSITRQNNRQDAPSITNQVCML